MVPSGVRRGVSSPVTRHSLHFLEDLERIVEEPDAADFDDIVLEREGGRESAVRRVHLRKAPHRFVELAHAAGAMDMDALQAAVAADGDGDDRVVARPPRCRRPVVQRTEALHLPAPAVDVTSHHDIALDAEYRAPARTFRGR